jgi:hypothetical protein
MPTPITTTSTSLNRSAVILNSPATSRYKLAGMFSRT